MPISPEVVGYIGGAIASVSLIPQVIHTCRTNSAKDLSYSWQIIHLTGLSVDVLYMVLLGGTAGWITLLIEIFFVLMLLTMKIRLECCTRATAVDTGGRRKSSSYQATGKVDVEDDEDTIDCSMSSSESMDESLDDLECQVVDKPQQSPETQRSEGRTRARPLRKSVDVDLTGSLPLDFGERLLNEVGRIARLHGVQQLTRPHLDDFRDGEGFSLSAGIGCSYLSVYCNQEFQLLSMDLHTRGDAQSDQLQETLLSAVLDFIRRSSDDQIRIPVAST